MHRNPLRAVHFGGVEHVGSLTGLDQDFGLAVEHRCDQTVLAIGQRHPGAGAVGVELGNIERAGVEQVLVGRAVGRVVLGARDELVDVIVALVIAGIDREGVVRADGKLGVFVLDTTERGALDRLALRIKGVDLDHPAKAVRLIAVLVHVETRIGMVPAIAEAIPVEAIAVLE